ncbi:Protein of unknown function [Blastococcus fimeti]|nr:Protein of unknown function [Blastococcus fimeti]
MTTPQPAPVLLDRALPPPPSARWRAREELRADLRPAAWLVLALAGVGVPAGLAWWLLAPRADFRITEDGPVVIGSPSSELLVADDAVFVLVLTVVGLLAGGAAWWMRRHRGVALLVALALGATAAGAVAWLVGEMFGEGPTAAELADVGGRVTTGLDLGATAALAVAPFVALLVYVLGVIVNAEDGLGRPAPEPAAPAAAPPEDAAPPVS